MSAHERDRLVSDLRVFSAAGVERAAWGWDQHGERQRERFHSAERSALHAIEQGDRGEQWDDFRKSIFDMTEGGRALVSWQYEHGPVGHKAERAAFGAALGCSRASSSRIPSTSRSLPRWPKRCRGCSRRHLLVPTGIPPPKRQILPVARGLRRGHG